MGLQPGGDPRLPLRPALRTLDPDTGRLDDVELGGVPFREHEHSECTGAHVGPSGLWQATRSHLLHLDPHTLALRAVVHHPLLHDVHAVAEGPGGDLLVSATGHDSVLRLRPDGALVAWWWLGHADGRVRTSDGGPPEGFEAAYGTPDWSTLPYDTFKPHRHHPNHIAWRDGEPWVTTLRTPAHRALPDGPAWPVPEGAPHDGLVARGLVWLTTTAGRLLGCEAGSGRRVVDLDLVAAEGAHGLPGWCRSVCVIGDDAYVAFSTLRHSRQRELLRAVLRGRHGHKLPTRLLRVHLPSGRLTGRWEVGNAGAGTVYGITPLPG